MNWQDFLELTRKGEDYETKFLGSVYHQDDLGPALTGMANTRGGRIIIGFDVHNYHLTGTDLDANWVNQLVSDFCTPKPTVDIQFVKKNDKSIMIITVYTSSEKPYYFKDKCYVLNFDKLKISVMEREATDLEYSAESSNVFIKENYDKKKQEQLNSSNIDNNIHTENLFLTKENEDIQQITNDLLELTNTIPTISKANKDTNIDVDKTSQEAISENDVSSRLIDVSDKPQEFNFLSTGNKSEELITDKIDSDNDVVKHQTLSNLDINKRQEETLVFLTKNEFIKNKRYRELFNVSHKTAHIELVQLVENKLLLTKGMGRSTRYVLNAPIQQST